MTTIKRGTIRGYDAAQHEASVQVAGSLAVYLPAVPIATGIPAAAVVAGRECGVVFFTDDDPADAVVVTVHGANPPPAASTKIEDADGDTSWDAEASADEDKLRGTVAGALRTLVQNASPHFTVTGDLQVSGWTGLGTAPVTNVLASVSHGTPSGKIGVNVALGATLGPSANKITGIGGYALAKTSGDNQATGLNFFAGMVGIDLTDAFCILTSGLAQGSGKTLTNFIGHKYMPPTLVFASLTNMYQDYYVALSGGTNRRYVYMEDIAGGTIARFIEMANAMYVKGTGEWTPAANETPVWIYEGATPTARQVRWKDGAAITSGDRVMVLV